MNTLSHELRAVIARRIEAASSREILTIASTLCADEERGAQEPTHEDRERAGREVDELPQPSMARFELIDAKQALDRSTNLIWTRQNVGDKRLTWPEAGEACVELDIGGSDAWRLPTIRELLSIVDYDRYDPAIDTDVFTCEAAWYWTSTPAARSPGDCAWLVDFGHGSAGWYGHDDDGFVRAVRPGQSRARSRPDKAVAGICSLDREQLVTWQAAIARFLAERLQLRLKAEKKLEPLGTGIDFLGYIVRPTHLIVRRRVVQHAREKLGAWERAHVHGRHVRATPAEYRAARSTWASYAGHFSHAASGRLHRRLRRQFPWIRTVLLQPRFKHRLEGKIVQLRGGPR